MGEVVDILAIFPQGHSLVMALSALTIANTMGIVDEERANFVLLTEIDHKAGGFVSQITNTTLCPGLDLVLGFLRLFDTEPTISQQSLQMDRPFKMLCHQRKSILPKV